MVAEQELGELWRRFLGGVPGIRSCARFYRKRTAQLHFAALTTLMAILVLGLIAAVLTVTNLGPPGQVSTNGGIVRTYYIAAEEVMWNYAPYGINMVVGRPFNSIESTYTAAGPQRIGTVYQKALYREYTDASFSQLKPTPLHYSSNGILGPVIYAEANDQIEIVFKNNASIPLSIFATGISLNSSAPYMPSAYDNVTSANCVLPGHNYTYLWNLGDQNLTSSSVPSTSLWSFYSQTDVYDVFAGLIGAIVITYPGNLVLKTEAATGIEHWGLGDVNQEVFAMLAVFDENLSPYFEKNIATFLGNDSGVNLSDPDFRESNLKYSINGYIYGNFPVEWNITANMNARWNVIALPANQDVHRAFWPGLLFGSLTYSTESEVSSLESLSLLPGEEKIVDMMASGVTGRTVFECQIVQKEQAGMVVAYNIV